MQQGTQAILNSINLITLAEMDSVKLMNRMDTKCVFSVDLLNEILAKCGNDYRVLHHAGTNWGEGFCLLNDQAIAANYLLANNLSKSILIIDLDVHQGNGTARIFENEPRVFTFSMHGDKNFPFRKEQSDLDIPLPDGIDDEEYLALLKDTLPGLINTHQPDFVFYLSGVDILESDKLGKLSLSKEACKERDRFVFEQCRSRGIPVQVSMGGGYSPQIKDIVEAHCNTYRVANDLYF